MKTTYLTSLLLASAFTLAGCGGAEKAAPAGNASNAAAPATPAGSNTTTGAGGGQPAPAAGPAADQTNQNFTLNNRTGYTVMTLNVSPNNVGEWGPDVLGRDVLANGESVEITFPRAETQCLWDIRATYEDGDTDDMRGVNLCELTTVNLTAE